MRLVRLAIATGTGPGEWGLDAGDWQVVVSFEAELQRQAQARGR